MKMLQEFPNMQYSMVQRWTDFCREESSVPVSTASITFNSVLSKSGIVSTTESSTELFQGRTFTPRPGSPTQSPELPNMWPVLVEFRSASYMMVADGAYCVCVVVKTMITLNIYCCLVNKFSLLETSVLWYKSVNVSISEIMQVRNMVEICSIHVD